MNEFLTTSFVKGAAAKRLPPASVKKLNDRRNTEKASGNINLHISLDRKFEHLCSAFRSMASHRPKRFVVNMGQHEFARSLCPYRGRVGLCTSPARQAIDTLFCETSISFEGSPLSGFPKVGTVIGRSLWGRENILRAFTNRVEVLG